MRSGRRQVVVEIEWFGTLSRWFVDQGDAFYGLPVVGWAATTSGKSWPPTTRNRPDANARC